MAPERPVRHNRWGRSWPQNQTFPKMPRDLPRHAPPCHPERSEGSPRSGSSSCPAPAAPPYCGLRAAARHPQCVHALSYRAGDASPSATRPWAYVKINGRHVWASGPNVVERQGGDSRPMWFRWSRDIPSHRDEGKPTAWLPGHAPLRHLRLKPTSRTKFFPSYMARKWLSIN